MEQTPGSVLSLATFPQRRGHMSAQYYGAAYKLRGKASESNRLGQHLVFCWVSHPVYDILSWQHRQTKTDSSPTINET